MKKFGSKRIIAAFLAVVMMFLMLPFGVIDSSAAADYTVPTTGHKLLSSYNVLSGTNISSGEADIKSSLDIFNRDKLDLLIGNYSSYTNMHTQLGEVHEGRDMESFAQSVGVSISGSTSASVGIEKLFKASATEKFGYDLDISYKEASDTYFYEYIVRVQKGYYNFNDAYLDLVRDHSNGYLSDAFVSALTGADGSTPEEFFAKYGTHIITAYTAGGEAGISLSSVKDSSSTNIDFSEMYNINAEASITESGITNGMSAALDLKNKVGVGIETSGYNSNATIYAYGGTKSVAFTTNGSTTTFNYTNWVDTLTSEESMVLVDERLKMIPIWNLLPSTGYEDRILDLTMHFVKESSNQDSTFYKFFGIDEALFDYSLDWLNFENCKIITNENELNEIRNDLNGVYVLANNIVLSNYANWESIGSEYEPFRGRLYGNNNTISGLNISKAYGGDESEKELIGLFGYNDGLITDLTISGNISITGISNSNAFVGAIAGTNNGIVSNCRDNVLYDLDYDSTDYLNLPLEYISETSNLTYTIGDSLGVYLLGNESTTFSNFNIAIEESENVGPVYIVLENAHVVGNSSQGTIYNPTARPIYIISKGSSNSISGGVGKPGYTGISNTSSDLYVFGDAPINIYGGTGSVGNPGSHGEQNQNGGPGDKGYAGGIGISASSLYVNASALNIYGGTGGAGGYGGNGNSAWYGGNRNGGAGGSGAEGGIALFLASTLSVSENCNLLICGGNGGRGGNGGSSGDDGVSGRGGNGGTGGFAALYSQLNQDITAHTIISNGFGGSGGSSGAIVGNGSYGGNGSTGSVGMTSPKATLLVGDKKYELFESKKNWDDAKLYAESVGGYLATITDEDEHALINTLLGYGSLDAYLIGAYRVEDNADVWAWVTDESFSYTNWATGEPNNTNNGEDYVGIKKDTLTWNDYPLTLYGYIIEYDVESSENIEDYLTGFSIGCNAEEGKARRINNIAWEENILQIESLTKTEYYSNDIFDPETVEITMYDKVISGYGKTYSFACDTNELWKMECVEISKDDYVRYIPVHITKVIPDRIEITNIGQSEFVVGEEFNINGLSVNVHYNNGQTTLITDNNPNLTYTTPSTQYADQTETVTITYKENGFTYSDTYDITTVTDTVERIFIQTNPSKTCFEQGDALLVDGLEVVGEYRSGLKKVIDNSYLKFDVSPSMCNIGTSTVTVKYEGKTCAYTITIEEKKDFDHSWNNGTITTEATHTSTGIMSYSCTVKNCDATKTESIPTIEGHTYGTWYKLNEYVHQRKCECGDTIEVAHIWNDGEVTIPATHLTEGEAVYSCTICEATETRTISKTTSHEFGKWAKFDEETHSHTCECGEVEYGNHSWDAGTIIVMPSYTEAGTILYTCDDCLATKSEDIPHLEIPEDAPYLVVDSKNAVKGNKLTVRISLKNNPGITSMRIKVAYDNTLLTLSDVSYSQAIGGQSVLPENIEALNGALVLYWANGFVDYTEDGVFATLTFKVSEGAEINSTSAITVAYEEEDIYNANEENIAFFCENGTITFIDYTPGDINGDGIINTKDTTRLMRYLAGWDVVVNEAALDVNGDGVVNTKDTTRLMRYLAGWDVEIY